VSGRAAALPAFVYLNNASEWLPLSEAAVRIGRRAICRPVSGEVFSDRKRRVFGMVFSWKKKCNTCVVGGAEARPLEVVSLPLLPNLSPDFAIHETE
jgi:hypothetical protein